MCGMRFGEKKIIKLSETVASALTELCKDENVVWGNSAYGGRRFGFKISKKWKNKYSHLLSTKDENFESPYSNGVVLTDYFRMISSVYFISQKFADILGLTDNHITLLRDTHYDYNEGGGIEDDDEDYKAYESEALFLGYKRPFGNSDVIDDVLEAFEISKYDENDDEIDKDWDEEYAYLLDDVVDKIKNFFVTCEYTTDIEAIYDGYSFEPTKSYPRKKKINNLLKN